MRIVRQAKSFSKDYKRIARAGQFDIEELKTVVFKLERNIPLEPRHQEHLLVGDLAGYSECHIRPNWLLIFRRDGEEELFLYRTGSHAELYG